MLKGNKRILKSFKQKKKAFTLLEIVVALGIVAIMIMTLGGALVTSVKANKMGEIKQESKLISQEIIEKLRSLGDITDCELTVGNNQTDKIEIKEIRGGNDRYEVTGNVNGIELISGSRIIKTDGIEEHYGSDMYDHIPYDLFFYIDDNEIRYVINQNKDIKYYMTEFKIEEKPIDGSKVFKVADENRLEIIWKEGNKVSINGNEHVLFNNNYNVGIYLSERRENISDRIDLHIENKMTTTENKYYFYRNKFVDGDCKCNKFNCECVNCKNPDKHCLINDCKCIDCSRQFRDSFKTKDKNGVDKEGRYIDGKIKIIDNIAYNKEKKNKGLYTIELNLKKKVPNGSTVTEKTRSEFLIEEIKSLN